jgi:hypothetical protein
VRFPVRTGDTLGALNGASWVNAGSQPSDEPPISLEGPLGAARDAQYLMVRALLASESRDGAPLLHTIAAQRACGIGVD